MAGRLLRRAARTTLKQVRHVTPVHPRHADRLTAEVYRQVERDFGMLAPPMSLHSSSPVNLAAAWTMLRESLVVTTSASRAAKEAVAAAVSASNTCPYCVEVHGATLHALEPDPVSDVVADWARTGGTWPFPEEHAPEMIGVAVTFHYLNRMVNVFLDKSPLPPGMPARGRVRAGRMLGRIMRGPALRGAVAGASTGLLPAAMPAPDLGWAEEEPVVHDAFGRAVAAVDAAAGSGVPVAVRELLATELSTWDGESPGLSRSWLERPVGAVPEADRPAARLALLVAKASYQVDDDTVSAYREADPRDAALVELASWAALSAARAAGTRLAGGRPGAAAAEGAA